MGVYSAAGLFFEMPGGVGAERFAWATWCASPSGTRVSRADATPGTSSKAKASDASAPIMQITFPRGAVTSGDRARMLLSYGAHHVPGVTPRECTRVDEECPTPLG